MPRIVTYNVRRCLGVDGRQSEERIAEVIARCEADIVALQELDIRRARTGGVDQAQAIARHLGMTSHFHPALRVKEELYGDAILTSRPHRLVKAAPLPSPPRMRLEPRGALWLAVDLDGVEVQVINTHLGLLRRERLLQATALLGEDWLAHPDCREPVILLGDFNAVPGARTYGRLMKRMRDAQSGRERRPLPTFPSSFPLLRIDHVFVSRCVEVLGVEVAGSPLARVASDHLPLTVEFRLRPVT